MPSESIRDFWIGIQAQAGEPAQFLRHTPVVECTLTPRDVRFIPKELLGSRIRERSSVRVRKWEEWSVKTYLRFDLFHAFASSSFNAPTSAVGGTTPTSQVQTISTTGGPTGGTFRLKYLGYETVDIQFNQSTSTLQDILLSLPSVRAGNVTVGGAPGAWTVTFGGGLATANNNLFVLSNNALSGGSSPSVTVVASTPGAGRWTHTYKGGGSNVPLLTIVYFDGVSYKLLLDASISSADYTFTTERCVEVDISGVSKFEKDFNNTTIAQTVSSPASITAGTTVTVTVASTTGMKVGMPLDVFNAAPYTNREVVIVTAVPSGTTFTAYFRRAKGASFLVKNIQLPDIIERAYNQPLDPTQLAVSVAGSNFADLVQAKLSVNQNREPFHTINAGVDLNKATEGEYQVGVDAQAEYNAFTGSIYEDFIDNTLPGVIQIVGTDTGTTIPISTGNPSATWNLPRPIIQEGTLDSNRPNVLQNIKGYGAFSVADATGIIFTLVNEEASAYGVGY